MAKKIALQAGEVYKGKYGHMIHILEVTETHFKVEWLKWDGAANVKNHPLTIWEPMKKQFGFRKGE